LRKAIAIGKQADACKTGIYFVWRRRTLIEYGLKLKLKFALIPLITSFTGIY
jgi:hypothetical protein